MAISSWTLVACCVLRLVAGICHGNVSYSEYSALWSLFNSTNGTFWNWSPYFPIATMWHFPCALSVPCSEEWQGIHCNSTNITTSNAAMNCMVMELSLPDFGLFGALPSSLANLTHVRKIVLSRNKLTGILPSELANLGHLHYLEIDDAKLTGTIPGVLFNGELETMQLSANNLTGTIPYELSENQRLIRLTLNENGLTGVIPVGNSSLPLLTNLDLSNNLLSKTIPSEIGNLRLLTRLYLGSNNLTGTIPSQLGKLPLVDVVSAESNHLSGSIPSEFGQLRFLVYLNLGSNQLTGTIPTELGNCTNALELSFPANHLVGSLPSELGALQIMQSLLLFSNCITGTIPTELGQVRLLFFNMCFNSLSGTIPSELGHISTMESLYLCNNRLTGLFPAVATSTMELLTQLVLSNNALSGTIDDSAIPRNVSLINIFLEGNLLSGKIPEAIFDCKSLDNLALFDNKLTGSLPAEIDLPSLKSIDLSGNLLVGSIPLYRTCPSLQSIDYSANYLTGQFKPSHVNCSTLISVEMGSNSLTGSIPPLLSLLTSLLQLNLSKNSFSGNLYSAVDSSQGSLQILDFSQNRLTGTIPSDIFLQSALHTVVLFSNCFSGTLPSSICSNPSIQNLVLDALASNCGSGIPLMFRSVFGGYISRGLMTGSIPECIWDMVNLELVHLMGNGLSGFIADFSNSSLSVLALSGNRMTGTIPLWLQQSGRLTQLALSENHFSGTLNSAFHMPQTMSLFGASINRLSGSVPSSLYQANSDATLDVLRGNVFSCSGANWAASWGSSFFVENLPPTDETSETYACGSSGLDNALWLVAFLIANVVIVATSMMLRAFTRTQIKSWARSSFETDQYLLLMTRSRLWNIWGVAIPVLLLLLIFYVVVKTVPLTEQFSSHSVQYLWVTTAAFMYGWAPTTMILLAIVACTSGLISFTREVEAKSTGLNEMEPCCFFLQWSQRPVAKILLHAVNIVAVVTVNVTYVYATVKGLSQGPLFAVQFALGCFKLAWSNIVIPALLRRFVARQFRPPHQIFMSLFAFIGGPFVSTFLSANNCFLYTIIQETPIESTVQISQYSCAPGCHSDCVFNKCVFACAANCAFSSTEMDVSTTRPWLYSYQCSSSLLTHYISVSLIALAISAVFMPLLIVILATSADPRAAKLLEKLMQLDSTSDLGTIDGYGVRVKTILNVTILLTFGLASPLLGFVVLLDSVLWCLVWHVLVGRQLELLRSTIGRKVSMLPSSEIEISTIQVSLVTVPAPPPTKVDVYTEFLQRSLQSMKDASQRPLDHFMVAVFVGVFWSLFMFDMIGDVYGDISGGLSMLIPLIMSLTIWLVRYNSRRLNHHAIGVVFRICFLGLLHDRHTKQSSWTTNPISSDEDSAFQSQS